MRHKQALGFFDSGIGGVSLLKQVKVALPNENFIYVSDAGHGPYGPRNGEFVVERALDISKFLIRNEVKAIVVACNTASCLALQVLQDTFDVPVIGVEPALHLALDTTRSNVVAVLATQGTLNSEKFNLMVRRYSHGRQVISVPCPEIVDLIEGGVMGGEVARNIAKKYTFELEQFDVDTIVLGCTHYNFIKSVFEEVVGEGVKVIDGHGEVVDTIVHTLKERDIPTQEKFKGVARFFTSGSVHKMEALLDQIWHESALTQSIASVEVQLYQALELS